MSNDSQYDRALDRFRQIYTRAQGQNLKEPGAVFLATADAEGRPSGRVVLLRGFDERGFVFFTNSQSDKGRQLESNPRAALCFYWEVLGEQIRVEGQVHHLTDDENDAYWRTRPHLSQIGAWASDQSRPLKDRATLEARVEQFQTKFAGHAVPRPPHWFGYRVAPDRIEFWTNRPGRLHDRILYKRENDRWTVCRLYP